MPLIIGLGIAADLARKHLPDHEQTVRLLRDALEHGLLGFGSSRGARDELAQASPPEGNDQSPFMSAATASSEGITNTELNGHPTTRLANTSNITFHSIESEALLILLDQEGICASSGSACLADSDEPSHVVKAMKPDTGASRQMIRFSLGVENTIQELETAVTAVRRAVRALKG